MSEETYTFDRHLLNEGNASALFEAMDNNVLVIRLGEYNQVLAHFVNSPATGEAYLDEKYSHYVSELSPIEKPKWSTLCKYLRPGKKIVVLDEYTYGDICQRKMDVTSYFRKTIPYKDGYTSEDYGEDVSLWGTWPFDATQAVVGPFIMHLTYNGDEIKE